MLPVLLTVQDLPMEQPLRPTLATRGKIAVLLRLRDGVREECVMEPRGELLRFVIVHLAIGRVGGELEKVRWR